MLAFPSMPCDTQVTQCNLTKEMLWGLHKASALDHPAWKIPGTCSWTSPLEAPCLLRLNPFRLWTKPKLCFTLPHGYYEASLAWATFGKEAEVIFGYSAKERSTGWGRQGRIRHAWVGIFLSYQGQGEDQMEEKAGRHIACIRPSSSHAPDPPATWVGHGDVSWPWGPH